MTDQDKRWMVVRKRDTEPPEVWIFDRYDQAAMHWDAVQANWSEVYFCRVAYGPKETGTFGERPTVPLSASARTVTRPLTQYCAELFYRLDGELFDKPANDQVVYLASEVAPLLTALAEAEHENEELQHLFDAFMDGQEASLGGKPRDSNPYLPGDSYGQHPLWAQWDDGYDCNINRVLKAALADHAQAVQTLATALRALIEDLDCGSYGERYDLDQETIAAVVTDLRPLADRLDALAGSETP